MSGSKWKNWKQDRLRVVKFFDLDHDIENKKLAMWVLDDADIDRKTDNGGFCKRVIYGYSQFLKEVGFE